MFQGSPWETPAGDPTQQKDPLAWFRNLNSGEKDVVYTKAYRKVGGQASIESLQEIIRMKILQRTRGGAFRLRKAFALFDRDSSGGIDPLEFRQAIEWFGVQVTEDQVLALFALYDQQRQGELEYHDFTSKVLGQDFVGFSDQNSRKNRNGVSAKNVDRNQQSECGSTNCALLNVAGSALQRPHPKRPMALLPAPPSTSKSIQRPLSASTRERARNAARFYSLDRPMTERCSQQTQL